MSAKSPHPVVAVIGGGITGLAAAHRIHELAPQAEVHLFEASGQIGGVLRTESIEGYLVEHSADMFTTAEDDAIELCRRMNYDQNLVFPNEDNRRALLVHNGKLTPMPTGLSLMLPTDIEALLTSPLLTAAGKERLLEEEKIPPRTSDEDESVAEFARRRFGNDVYTSIIQPMVGGIYTGDPEKLSMQSTMAKFLKLEQKFGSLTAAGRESASPDRQASGARYSLFRTPKLGMQDWVTQLANRLPARTISLDSPVEAIARDGEQWRLQCGKSWRAFDGVVVAVESPTASRLLQPIAPSASSAFAEMTASSTAIVVVGHDRSQFDHPLDAFGFIVPAAENRKILAASFASNKYPGRAPDEKILVRIFIGGELQAALLQHTDKELIAIARSEMQSLTGMQGESDFAKVVRWPNSMPQYNLGHQQRVAAIETEIGELAGLEVAGKTLTGVGLPACIRSAESAAARVVERLKDNN